MKAEFIISAAAAIQFPKTDFPEVAFAGRSNVGKSSMINKLLLRKNLVKVGNAPGKTRLVNFFNVDDKFIFTDLPGYGYAAVSKSMRNEWGKLINAYFERRTQLSLCVMLLDIRRRPNEDDMIMLESMRNSSIRTIAVLTKVDKLSGNGKTKQTQVISDITGIDKSSMILFSAVTGQGRDEIWNEINKLDLLFDYL